MGFDFQVYEVKCLVSVSPSNEVHFTVLHVILKEFLMKEIGDKFTHESMNSRMYHKEVIGVELRSV